jgi:histidyl-tRNA synthetase
VTDGADRIAVLPVAAELRRRGVSTDLDYAGRSFKGQMRQAGRTSAPTVAIVRADGVTIRRGGRDAETVALAQLADTLSAK